MSLKGAERIARGGLSVAGEELFDEIRSVAINDNNSSWLFNIRGEVLEVKIDDVEDFSVLRQLYIKTFTEPAPYVTPKEWIKILQLLRKYKCSDMMTECCCDVVDCAELDY